MGGGWGGGVQPLSLLSSCIPFSSIPHATFLNLLLLSSPVSPDAICLVPLPLWDVWSSIHLYISLSHPLSLLLLELLTSLYTSIPLYLNYFILYWVFRSLWFNCIHLSPSTLCLLWSSAILPLSSLIPGLSFSPSQCLFCSWLCYVWRCTPGWAG